MQRKYIIEAVVIICILILLTIWSIPNFIRAQNVNTPEHFPDPVFHQKVEQFMGVEAGGRIRASDLAAKTGFFNCAIPDMPPLEHSQLSPALTQSYRGFPDRTPRIQSLKGLEYFRNITGLDVSGHQIKELDVSHNTKLKILACRYNQLTELDLSNNPDLIELYCGSNQFNSLDLSNNLKLRVLSCQANKLSDLQVNHLKNLEVLDCSMNYLSNINIDALAALKVLRVSRNNLTELDITHNSKLYELFIIHNRLQSLNVSHNPELTVIHCENNQLTVLDVSTLSRLEKLYCSSNQISELDVSNCSQLQWLSCISNQLKQIDLSQNLLLTNLELTDNLLTELPDLRNHLRLEALGVDKNYLTCEDAVQLKEIMPRFTGTWAVLGDHVSKGLFYTEQKNDVNLNNCD
jgi:Leucine-rich repeat (LRR) protein